MERENLAGDVRGKGASGSNREAESTDAPERGGLPCSSDEAGVMLVERRGWVIAVELGPTGSSREAQHGGFELQMRNGVDHAQYRTCGCIRGWVDDASVCPEG